MPEHFVLETAFLLMLSIRMQRKQYANIEIVQTEMKGFGLRAGSDIPKCVSFEGYDLLSVHHGTITIVL